MYHVYVVQCADKTFYVGSTSDLEKRLYAHNHLKSGAHYTKIRRPVVLKYSERCVSYAEARKREGELKRLTRKEKFDILQSINNPINLKKSMAKGNNSQKKDARKPKKAKK